MGSNTGDLRARPTSSRSRPLLFLVDSSSPSRPSSTKSPSPPARTRSRLVEAPRCTTPPEAASAAAETVSPPSSTLPCPVRVSIRSRSLRGKGKPPRDLLLGFRCARPRGNCLRRGCFCRSVRLEATNRLARRASTRISVAPGCCLHLARSSEMGFS